MGTSLTHPKLSVLFLANLLHSHKMAVNRVVTLESEGGRQIVP